jgi:hypothetical protein
VVAVDGVGRRGLCCLNIDNRKGSLPFLQTIPYDHKGRTKFTPRWLTQLFSQAGIVVWKIFTKFRF